METPLVTSDLTDSLRRFRDMTGLSAEKIGHLAGLHSRTVQNVISAEEGQRFSAETERKLRDAMAGYLRDHVLDAYALYGELTDDPDLEDAVARAMAKRPRR